MIVVADSPPINYLILIGQIDLLPKLFADILIPGAVAAELGSSKSPVGVREWIGAPPSNIKIVSSVKVPASLMHLDPGERESLALAEAIYADRLLLDDGNARRKQRRGASLLPVLWASCPWRRTPDSLNSPPRTTN